MSVLIHSCGAGSDENFLGILLTGSHSQWRNFDPLVHLFDYIPREQFNSIFSLLLLWD